MKDTEELVCEDIKARAVKGLSKYGTTVADNPLSLRQWLQHSYEEMLDQCVYLRRAMQEIDHKGGPVQKWRMLKEGEVIEEGDEFLDGVNWLRSFNSGKTWNPRDWKVFRRRVTPDLSELNQHITELLKHE